MAEPPIEAAHRASIRHAEQVRGSALCGCFYCLAVFAPAEIGAWADRGETALCPRCGIDAVLGDGSGFPIGDVGFLTKMRNYWFEGRTGNA